MVIGILVFGFVFVLAKGFFLNKFSHKNTPNFCLNRKLVYVLVIITIILYIKDLFIFVECLIDGRSFSYIRKLVQDSTSIFYISRTNIEKALRLLIINPFTIALQPIVAIDIQKGKKDKILLILNLILLVLKTFSDGSRILMVCFAMHLCLVFLYYHSELLTKFIKK